MTVHLTHRELYGTRAELLGGLAVVFAPPLLGLYSLRRYPLVDAWDPLYIVLALGGFLLTLPPLVVYRHTLFRWGHKLPAMQWIGIAALAVLAAMLALGIGLIANGALDRGDRATLEAKVVRKWRRKGNYHLVLAPRNSPDVAISLSVPKYDYARAVVGAPVRVEVRPGALGRPWIANYSLH